MCVHTPSTTPTAKKSKKHHSITIFERIPSDFLQVLLISLTRTYSTNLLSNNCQMYELILLGFPRHARRLILDDAFVWNFESEFLCNPSHSPSYSLKCHVDVCNELLEFCLMKLAIACIMNFLRGLLTQTVVLVRFLCMYFSSFVIPRSTNCDSLM